MAPTNTLLCMSLVISIAAFQHSFGYTLPDINSSTSSSSVTNANGDAKVNASGSTLSSSASAEEAPITANYCSHSSCGWEIQKRTSEIVFVDSGCVCRPTELCIRTHNDYRLPGFKYHCRVVDTARRNEVVLFPNRTDIGSNGFFKYYP